MKQTTPSEQALDSLPPPSMKTPAPAAEFHQKSAQLHPGQSHELDSIAKSLQRQRTDAKLARLGGGPRITANTLIRVAVTHLLAHRDVLTGNTESDLLNSLNQHR